MVPMFQCWLEKCSILVQRMKDMLLLKTYVHRYQRLQNCSFEIYPPRIYDVIFVFDQAKIHTAFDDDALIASR